MKICSKCKTEKPPTEFHKHKKSKDGLAYTCKECAKARANKWAKDNKERVKANTKAYRANNKDLIKEKKKQYHIDNAEKLTEKTRQWRKNNPEKYRETERAYRKNNKDKIYHNNQNWRDSNRDKDREIKRNYANSPEGRKKGRQWKKDNPGKVNAAAAKRRAAKLQATPPWLTKEQKSEIVGFYIKAREMTDITGIPHHVDHIMPLNGENTCGLHVPWNLQILTAEENITKSNKIVTKTV